MLYENTMSNLKKKIFLLADSAVDLRFICELLKKNYCVKWVFYNKNLYDDLYKLGYQETSGYNKLKSKLDATNELRKKVFDANLQNEVMNPKAEKKDQMTWGQFLLKRSTQNELDKINYELDLGLFKQKGKGAFFEESAKAGFFNVKDSLD